MNIGQRLVELRQKKGWTTNRLAKEAGIAQSALRSIERGEKSPTLDTLSLIAAALGLTLADLFAQDILQRVMGEYDRMDLDEMQQAKLARLRELSDDEKKALLEKVFSKIKSLPPETQKALTDLLSSLV